MINILMEKIADILVRYCIMKKNEDTYLVV